MDEVAIQHPDEPSPAGEPPAIADPLNEGTPDAPQPRHEDTPAVPHLLAALAAAAERTASGLAQLLQEQREQLALDRFREEQIARLHGELQSYKDDQIGKAARQILYELIILHDAIGKAAAAWRHKPQEELTAERLQDLLDGFHDDIEMALARHGVVPYTVAGDAFDPHRQTALRTVAAPGPGSADRIAERVRPGFVQGTAFLQKERVTVYIDRAPGGDHSSGDQS
jgi:molecular chaperone GrpE (heat shock protein)